MPTLRWDGCALHFEDKAFVKAKTRSVDHVPTDMGEVFAKTFGAIEKAEAYDPDDFIVLSRDLSASEGEHYFAVSKPVPGEEVVHWSGDYATKLFEGPYEDAPKWEAQFEAELKQQGHEVAKTYFFYTTCPKCAQVYGKNYVVAVAEFADHPQG